MPNISPVGEVLDCARQIRHDQAVGYFRKLTVVGLAICTTCCSSSHVSAPKSSTTTLAPSSSAPCSTAAVEDALATNTAAHTLSGLKCDDGWAVAHIQVTGGQGGTLVLKAEAGKWKIIEQGGCVGPASDFGIPAAVYRQLLGAPCPAK